MTVTPLQEVEMSVTICNLTCIIKYPLSKYSRLKLTGGQKLLLWRNIYELKDQQQDESID